MSFLKKDKLDKTSIMAWAMYDWAQSAFATIITTFIFAAYFTKKVAVNEIMGTRDWGYAVAIAGIIIVLLSPICGAIADHSGRRKPWLILFTLLSIIGSALFWYAYPNPSAVSITLFALIIGTIGIELSSVFYNAFLPHLAPSEYFGRISGWGWGCGYAGGLVSLVIALYIFVLGNQHWLDTHTAEQVRICGPFVAVWILLFSLPLFIKVSDYPAGYPLKRAIIYGLQTLSKTLKTLPKRANISRYLIAHMLYTDGLNTVFAFGGIYAAGTFGMNLPQVIQFGILTNIAAGIGAISFAWIDDWIGPKKTVLISILGLLIAGTTIVLIHSKIEFIIMTMVLSLFFGPVQAASRTLMARIAPRQEITEMFGLYALSGRITSFVGPWLLGTVTLYFKSQRAGMASLLIFFIIGGLLLLKVKD